MIVFIHLKGIGYGLIYLPAATIVTAWFVKKRATVTGIIMAGSGIGVAVYSLTLPHLISVFTWRGCIILLAAINLHCAVAGALFRPLTHYTLSKPSAVGAGDADVAQAETNAFGSVLSCDRGSRRSSIVQYGVNVNQDAHIKVGTRLNGYALPFVSYVCHQSET